MLDQKQKNPLCSFLLNHSPEEDNASVGHGIRQSQDSTAHYSVAQVEHWHAERGFSFKLREKIFTWSVNLISSSSSSSLSETCVHTSVKRVVFFPSAEGRNSAFSWVSSGSSSLLGKSYLISAIPALSSCLCVAKHNAVSCDDGTGQIIQRHTVPVRWSTIPV